MTKQSCIILAGAGVVRDGVVDDLREVVTRTNIGVFNSWAAKGLFRWDSPAHFGTVGLQRDDFVRAQLADATEVVVVGCDEHEAPRQLLTDLGVAWRAIATGDLRTFTHVGVQGANLCKYWRRGESTKRVSQCIDSFVRF